MESFEVNEKWVIYIPKWLKSVFIFTTISLILLFINSGSTVENNYNIIIIGSGLLLIFLRGLWLYLVAKTTKYTINKNFIIKEYGILNKSKDSYDVVKVKGVKMERPLIYRLFKLSRINVSFQKKSLLLRGLDSKKASPIFDFINLNATDSYVEYRRRATQLND